MPLSQAGTRAKLIDPRLFIYAINRRHQFVWNKWSQAFTLKEFHRLCIEDALPLLKRWNFDVVAHGPSLGDENMYYVIRCFDSLAQREQMEDAYYASDDWRNRVSASLP